MSERCDTTDKPVLPDVSAAAPLPQRPSGDEAFGPAYGFGVDTFSRFPGTGASDAAVQAPPARAELAAAELHWDRAIDRWCLASDLGPAAAAGANRRTVLP